MKKIKINKWDTYWNLVILNEIFLEKRGRYFNCKCFCWKEKIIRLDSFINWYTKSCGCLNTSKIWEDKKVDTKIYKVWASLKSRCNNINIKEYKNYWGRWITYDKKWEKFKWFYEDMWESYNIHYKENNWDTTIDRKENDWNYCKDNCRWIINKKQQRNKRNNILYEWKCIAEIIEKNNLDYWKTYYRLSKGWSMKKILNFNNIKMIYKSKSYSWDGQDISFEVNWTVRTRIKDPSQVSWFRDSKITFKNWNETKGPDRLNLPMLYFDVFPEFTKMVDGEIKLRSTRVEEMFPWTVFEFKLTSDDVFIPKEEEKMWDVDPKLLLQIKNDLKEEIIQELRAELIKEIVAELKWDSGNKVLDNYSIPENHKLIQKDKSWKVIWSFLNAPHAAQQTWVSKSSISQNIKWVTITAWGFIWSLKKDTLSPTK